VISGLSRQQPPASADNLRRTRVSYRNVIAANDKTITINCSDAAGVYEERRDPHSTTVQLHVGRFLSSAGCDVWGDRKRNGEDSLSRDAPCITLQVRSRPL